jgi:HEAT repeat protein
MLNKRLSYIILILIVALGTLGSASAQDTDALLRQLCGKEEAPARSPVQLEKAYQKALGVLIKGMSQDASDTQYGYQIQFQLMAMHAARPGADVERQALAGLLADKISDPNIEVITLNWIILQLQRIGNTESVGPLTALLRSDEKSVRDYARRALEKNPDDGATDALLKALAKTKDPVWTVGLINSIGERQADEAIKALTSQMKSQDHRIAYASVKALGTIASEKSVQILQEIAKKPTHVLAPFCAETLIDSAGRMVRQGDTAQAAKIFQGLYRTAAKAKMQSIQGASLNGLIVCKPKQGARKLKNLIANKDPKVSVMAIQAARVAPTSAPTRTLGNMLNDLPAPTQVQVLGLIAERGDAALVEASAKLLNSPDESVRLAAIDVLVGSGLPGSAKQLMQLAASAQGDTQKQARNGLITLGGKGVQEVIVVQAASGDQAARIVAIDALGERRMPGTRPLLLSHASDSNPKVSAAAIQALTTVAGPDDVGTLADLAVKAKDKTVRGAALKTLKSVLLQGKDSAQAADTLIGRMDRVSGDVKLSLLGLLSDVGGRKALQATLKAAKSSNESVSDAGIRTLSDWPQFEAVEPLLALAGDADKSVVHHVLMVRGVLRLAKADETASAEDRLSACTQAMGVARRINEKKMAVSTLGNIPSQAAAAKLLGFAKVSEYKNQAALALVQMADALTKSNRSDARVLAQKIIDLNISEEINGRANRILSGRRR